MLMGHGSSSPSCPICRNPFELFRDADKRTLKAILIIIARLQIKRTVLPFAIRPRFRSNNKIRKQNNALTPKITAKRTPSEPHPQRRSADIYFFGKLTLSFSGRGPGSTLLQKGYSPKELLQKPLRPARQRKNRTSEGAAFPCKKGEPAVRSGAMVADAAAGPEMMKHFYYTDAIVMQRACAHTA